MTDGRLKPLKFAPASRTNAVVAAREGRRAATVRYDDEKGIEAGDRLCLKDATADSLEPEVSGKFGEADVVEVETMPSGDAYAHILSQGVLYPAQSYDQMMGDLNDRYGGGIYPWTEVEVIIFDPDAYSFVDHPEGRIYRFMDWAGRKLDARGGVGWLVGGAALLVQAAVYPAVYDPSSTMGPGILGFEWAVAGMSLLAGLLWIGNFFRSRRDHA